MPMWTLVTSEQNVKGPCFSQLDEQVSQGRAIWNEFGEQKIAR